MRILPVLALLAAYVSGCNLDGGGSSPSPAPAPAPNANVAGNQGGTGGTAGNPGANTMNPGSTAGGGTVTYASVQAIFTRNCGGCHPGSKTNDNYNLESTFAIAGVKQEVLSSISSGAMPKGARLSSADLNALTAYLNQR